MMLCAALELVATPVAALADDAVGESVCSLMASTPRIQTRKDLTRKGGAGAEAPEGPFTTSRIEPLTPAPAPGVAITVEPRKEGGGGGGEDDEPALD